jgi:NAD(P)-dependent dehydrogenase (short-subunit alcohol dehydrogenase family)
VELQDKVVVVTGGAAGIGRALCERFRRERPRAVVVVDRDGAGAVEVADAVGGFAIAADVSVQADIERVVDQVEARVGPIDLFCSNAGVMFADPDPEDAASDTVANWNRGWGVNVMAHVYAAKALIPRYRSRGGGYLLNTVSAAGLLSQIGSGVYSTTKHAAIGFAEHVAITHRAEGIRVSVLCPQAVDTALIRHPGLSPGMLAAAVDGVLPPAQVAEDAVRGIAEERFLILPHPQVLTYLQRKATDYDRWIDGMSRLRADPPQR